MSYILDALKKAEKERQRRQVPDMATIAVMEEPRTAGDHRRLWLLLVAVLVVMAGLFYGSGLQKNDVGQDGHGPQLQADSPQPTEGQGGALDIVDSTPVPGQSATDSSPSSAAAGNHQVIAADQSVSAKPVAKDQTTAPEQPPDAPSSGTAATDSGAVLAGNGTTAGSRQMDNQPSAPFPAVVEPMSVDDSIPAADSAGWPVMERPVLPVLEKSQLPAAIAAQLPELTINLHLYSEDVARRRVSINGHMRRQGDRLATDLVLSEITADGVILDYNQYRIHLPVFH
jgi:general secretion pathway protein B